MINTSSRFSTLRARILSGTTLAAVAALAIVAGGYYLAVAVAIAVGVGAWEISEMLGRLRGHLPLPLTPALAICLSLLWLAPIPAGVLTVVLIVPGVVGLTGILRMSAGSAGFLLAAFYPAWLGFFLAADLLRPGVNGFGAKLLLIAVMGVAGCDIAAYFVGSAWGRHRFFAQISPRKSLEGAIAGWVVAAVLVVILASLWLDARLPLAMLLGVAIGVVAQAGDLLESALKRRVGVKDSSRLIPGHGGLLDRLDSLLLVGPMIYCWAKWLL